MESLEQPVHAVVQGHEDVLLALEVVVQRRLGDPELLGYLPKAGLVVTLLDEEVQGHIEDSLPGVMRAGLTGPGHGAVVVSHSPFAYRFGVHGVILLDDR